MASTGIAPSWFAVDVKPQVEPDLVLPAARGQPVAHSVLMIFGERCAAPLTASGAR
jgi:hypothetical protein